MAGKAKPGWYPHPQMHDTLRYWDGARWTDHVQPARYAGVPKRMQPAQVVGTLLALLIVVAVILAIAFGRGT